MPYMYLYYDNKVVLCITKNMRSNPISKIISLFFSFSVLCIAQTYLHECLFLYWRKYVHTYIFNGAKLGVAPVARAPPLFLPRPELKYIYVLHTSAPPRTYLVRATLLLSPDWRHWLSLFCTLVL